MLDLKHSLLTPRFQGLAAGKGQPSAEDRHCGIGLTLGSDFAFQPGFDPLYETGWGRGGGGSNGRDLRKAGQLKICQFIDGVPLLYVAFKVVRYVDRVPFLRL